MIRRAENGVDVCAICGVELSDGAIESCLGDYLVCVRCAIDEFGWWSEGL